LHIYCLFADWSIEPALCIYNASVNETAAEIKLQLVNLMKSMKNWKIWMH